MTKDKVKDKIEVSAQTEYIPRTRNTHESHTNIVTSMNPFMTLPGFCAIGEDNAGDACC